VAAPLVLGRGVGEPLTPLYLRRPDAIAAATHKPVSGPMTARAKSSDRA
jgi:hypothetical protein